MELIQPIFVNQSGSTREAGLGVENKNYSQTDLFERIQKDIDLGVDSFLLFTTPDTKTWLPTWDWQSEIVNKIKNKFPKIELIVDVCLCSTLPDGHCRVMDKPDTTAKLLLDLGKKLDKAGADILAPSDMGDLTVRNLHAETEKKVMAYVKWRSVFYSSFRELANSNPSSERTYQMNIKNEWDATGTAHKYDSDGADMLLMKPAYHSLDIIGLVKCGTYKPVGMFQVSDEYKGLPTLKHQIEAATIIKRAGARFLVSYGARDLVNNFREFEEQPMIGYD
jgi:porphobilinogen synthase